MDIGAASGKPLDVVIVGGGFGGMYAVYKYREMVLPPANGTRLMLT